MTVPNLKLDPSGIVNTSVDFSPSDYANLNADVKSVIGSDDYDLALHWVCYGQSESRQVLANQIPEKSAVVQLDTLNKAFETTDLSVSGGELSVKIGPVYKTYNSAGDVVDSDIITTSVQIHPLLYSVPVVYPQTFQYTNGTQLKFTNSFNLDLTNYTNFYIELDGSEYYVDSVETPVLSFTPDKPNLDTVKNYWGKTGNIYVKATATINKTGEIVSYPAIKNSSPNRYLFDIIEFNNPTAGNSRYYRYFLTTFQYGLEASSKNDNVFGFFQTSLKTCNGAPIVPQTLPLILLDKSASPLWIRGTTVYSNKAPGKDYRPIESVTFNSVNNTTDSVTTYTGFALNNFYYDNVSRQVTEESTWWVYFDNVNTNKITPRFTPDYGTGNTTPNDTIDIVYGVSDSVYNALMKAIDAYLENNADLINSSGGNLTNIKVTKEGLGGTITFKNFVQVKSDDIDKNITINLFNDITDLKNWNAYVQGIENKYNVTTKSFLDITVSYNIDSNTVESETNKHYELWDKTIEIESIKKITVNTYTASETKTSIALLLYPVFYCNFTKTDQQLQTSSVEKWYTILSPTVSQSLEIPLTETMALFSKQPFKYTASLYSYIVNVVPFTFNLPSILLPSSNLYQNDKCNLDPSINRKLDNILYSQINYANSFIGNEAIEGPNSGSIDLISLVDKEEVCINVQNSPTNQTDYVNPVYPNPVYDFDKYNLLVDSKINVLNAYNYTIVPLLTNTGTILALNQIYRHFSITGNEP